MPPLARVRAGYGQDLVAVAGSLFPAAEVVAVEQEDPAVLALLGQDVRIGGRAERQPDRPASAQVLIARVERGRVGGAEEVLCRQRPIRVRGQPHHRLRELAWRAVTGALGRGDAVTRGEEDPPWPVGHKPAATLPDSGLVVADAGLVGPQRRGDRALRNVYARHVTGVGLMVTV